GARVPTASCTRSGVAVAFSFVRRMSRRWPHAGVHVLSARQNPETRTPHGGCGARQTSRVTGKVTVIQPNTSAPEPQRDPESLVPVPVRDPGRGGAIILVASPNGWVYRRLLAGRCLLRQEVE